MPKSITFKATNNKYYLNIHPDASMEDVYRELAELIEYLTQDSSSRENYELLVRTGRRLLTNEEKSYIYSIVEKSSNWHITSIESDVVTIKRAINWHKEVNTRIEFKTIEAGETLEAAGDILLVGNVEPGGFIRAAGNIYILGDLKGVADAGIEGNEDAVIIGTFKNNSKIRINKVDYSIEHSLDNGNVSLPNAYYLNKKGFIDTTTVDQLQEIRPEIDRVTRGLNLSE